jgi:predicted RNA binding protein with dsRBD fold (UPF0201 family)
LAKNAEEDLDRDRLEVSSAPPSCQDLVLEISTPFHPTEDAGLVGLAMANLFPVIDLAVGDGRMTGTGEGPITLARLRRRLREMRIRDTARSVLRSGAFDGAIAFSLNKQSAVVNVPNFSTGGAPLGDIDVSIRTSDVDALVEWLCALDAD